mmetsp:Transcript_42484/g.131191  ORF Transcript_42484/g.131191 Transcript_42484/m.131191 type:complete len:226 (-) Transcript_42484:130-807(-)
MWSASCCVVSRAYWISSSPRCSCGSSVMFVTAFCSSVRSSSRACFFTSGQLSTGALGILPFGPGPLLCFTTPSILSFALFAPSLSGRQMWTVSGTPTMTSVFCSIVCRTCRKTAPAGGPPFGGESPDQYAWKQSRKSLPSGCGRGSRQNTVATALLNPPRRTVTVSPRTSRVVQRKEMVRETSAFGMAGAKVTAVSRNSPFAAMSSLSCDGGSRLRARARDVKGV